MREFLSDPAKKDLVELPEGTMEQLARLERKNIRDMTAEEVEVLYQTVMHYALMAYDWNYIRVQEEIQERDKLIDGSIAQMKKIEEIAKHVIDSQGKPIPTSVAKTIDKLDAFFGIGQEHYDLFVEKISGENSIADRLFGKAIEAARTEELKYKQQIHDRFQEGLEEIGITPKNAAQWFHEKVRFGKGEADYLTRAERIALKMHSENEDNWASITEAGFGFKFKEGERDLVLKPGVDFTVEDLNDTLGSLTNQELAVADLLREIDDQIGEDIAELFVSVNGYEMPRVENHWYKDVMPIGRGSDAVEQGVKEMVEGTMLRPGVPKGRLKERKGVVVPLYLNSAIYDLVAAVDWASSYLAFERPMREATKVLQNSRFKSELIKRYGRRLYNEIQKGLKDVLNERTAVDDLANLWNVARKGITTAYIAGNPFTMLKKPLQLTNALRYVSPASLTYGVWKTTLNMGKQKNQHKMYSPKYRDRLERGFTRDIVEFQRLRERRAWVSAKKDFRNIMFAGVKFFDANTVSAVMDAAVHQVLMDHKAGRISPEVQKALNMSNDQFMKLDPDHLMSAAYQFADYVVARTQDMALPEHRSPLSRGGPVARAFTMFGASTNQNWNLLKRSLIEAIRYKNKRAYRAAGYAVLSVLVIQPLAESGIDMLREFLTKPGEPPEDREYLWKVLSNISGNLLLFRDVFRSLQGAIRRKWGAELTIPVSGAARIIGKTINDGIRMGTARSIATRRRYAYRFLDDVIDLILIWGHIPIYYPKNILRKILRSHGIWPYHMR